MKHAIQSLRGLSPEKKSKTIDAMVEDVFEGKNDCQTKEDWINGELVCLAMANHCQRTWKSLPADDRKNGGAK